MSLFEINLFWLEIKASFYGFMYALSFVIWYMILNRRKFLSTIQLDDLMMYIFAWVILWGRLWYVIFYNLDYYLSNLLDIFKVWEWWMSFHGWALWVILGLYIFSKRNNVNFLKLWDEICTIVPIWLLLGRIWNYFNKELLGFSGYNGPLAIEKAWVYYFPSPLVEAFLEWFVLLIILNIVYRHKKFNGQISALFLAGYWIFRLLVEIFFREPDSHLWLFFWFISMWELLSLPMIAAWVLLYYFCNKK